MKNKGKTHQGPPLVAATVNKNRSDSRNPDGVHLVVREGKYANKTIYLPNDGVGMQVGPYEWVFLVETDLTVKKNFKTQKFFLSGEPVCNKSFGFDLDSGRNRASEELFAEIQSFTARQAMAAQKVKAYQQAPQTKGAFPFLEKGRYGMKVFASLASEESTELLVQFLMEVAATTDGCPGNVSLGSFISVDGVANSAVLMGPKALVVAAAKVMMDENGDWRVITAKLSPEGDKWGVTLTTVPVDKWNFDPEAMLQSITKASTPPPAAKAAPAPAPAPAPVAKQQPPAPPPPPSTPKGTKPKVIDTGAAPMINLGVALTGMDVVGTPEPEKGTTQEPEPEVVTTPEPEPVVTPEPQPVVTPEPEKGTTQEPEVETPAPEPEAQPEVAPEPEVEPEPESSAEEVFAGSAEPVAVEAGLDEDARKMVGGLTEGQVKTLLLYSGSPVEQRAVLATVITDPENKGIIELYESCSPEEQAALTAAAKAL